jgi:outer membrane protein assembly factor BamB
MRGLNRRDILKASALALPGSSLVASQPASAREAITLPDWRYGKNSAATDTVLMFRGNGAHTFYGTGPIPEANPRVLWRFRTAVIRNTVRGTPMTWTGTGWTGTAVNLGDYVFFGSVGGYVYALDAKSGKQAWRLKGGGMFKASICAYENRLYIGNTDNLLRCIDAATGQTVWRVDTGKDLDSSAAVVDDKLYIAGENGYLRCLVPQTGKQIWRTFVDGIGPGTVLGSNGSETSPAVADGEVYTATYDGILFCVDAKSGDVRWRARTGDDTDASPVIHDEFVYACAEEKSPYLFCFAREDGRQVWRYGERTGGFYSTPAIVGDRLWVWRGRRKVALRERARWQPGLDLPDRRRDLVVSLRCRWQGHRRLARFPPLLPRRRNRARTLAPQTRWPHHLQPLHRRRHHLHRHRHRLFLCGGCLSEVRCSRLNADRLRRAQERSPPAIQP